MEKQNESYRWVIIFLLFLSLFFGSLAMNCVPPLLTEISSEIPLTKAQMGTVMGVTMLAALFFAPVGGGMSDKIGCRWAIGAGAVVIALSSALRSVAYSSSALIGYMFALGAGMAIIYANVPKSLGLWVPPNEMARANGISMAGISVGMAVGMGISAGYLSPTFGGWRGTMLLLAAFALVMAILWMLFYRDREGISAGTDQPQNLSENFKKVFKDREIILLAIFYCLIMMGLMGLFTLLPVIFEERGIARAGELVSIMMGANVIFNVLGGILSDKVGKRKPFLVVSALIAGICVPAFGVFTGFPLVIALFVCGASSGNFLPVLFAIPVEMSRVGAALAGTAVGVIMMIGNTGGFIGPAFAGKLMDLTGSMWPGFIFMAAVFIVAAAVILPVKETGQKKERKGV